MNVNLLKAIWIEAVIAFFIPAATTAGTAIGVWAGVGAPQPNDWAVTAATLSSLVAGASGLKSFLSTAFSDAKDAQTPPPAAQPKANP